ncbi:hypothetical protein ACFPA8_22385 [Streptomyces ovatisporus]|uniref:Uncharacterized protein n=1 Tax=Streptomyces ovatisporus TaxID=1128682 RepID=A0ABV9ADF2_9ACTN
MADRAERTGDAVGAWRERSTDPAAVTAVMAVAAVCAALYSPALTWAVTGGLAGFSLSGSV